MRFARIGMLVFLWAASTAFAVSTARGDEPSAQLIKELGDLVESRRSAIKSIDIEGESVTNSSVPLLRHSQQTFLDTLNQYAGSHHSDDDRKAMYRALFQQHRGGPLPKPVRLVKDGLGRSLAEEGHRRYVADDRATVRTFYGALDRSRIMSLEIWNAYETRTGSLDMQTFSVEFENPYLKSVTPQGITLDANGHFLISGATPAEKWTAEISREDGILKRLQVDRREGRIITVQVGRLMTSAGITFPAVIGTATFSGDSLRGLMLKVPTSVKVNDPIEADTFRQPAPTGTTVTDKRYGNVGLTEKDYADVVEFVNEIKKRRDAPLKSD